MSSGKLWGGRFAETTHSLVERFSESVSFDARLWRHDILASQAHARMLGRVGVIFGGNSKTTVGVA
jgi:argininosuccinate lyase